MNNFNGPPKIVSGGASYADGNTPEKIKEVEFAEIETKIKNSKNIEELLVAINSVISIPTSNGTPIPSREIIDGINTTLDEIKKLTPEEIIKSETIIKNVLKKRGITGYIRDKVFELLLQK